MYVAALVLAVGLLIQTDRTDSGLAIAVALLAVADLSSNRAIRVVAAGLGAVTLATDERLLRAQRRLLPSQG